MCNITKYMGVWGFYALFVMFHHKISTNHKEGRCKTVQQVQTVAAVFAKGTQQLTAHRDSLRRETKRGVRSQPEIQWTRRPLSSETTHHDINTPATSKQWHKKVWTLCHSNSKVQTLFNAMMSSLVSCGDLPICIFTPNLIPISEFGYLWILILFVPPS